MNNLLGSSHACMQIEPRVAANRAKSGGEFDARTASFVLKHLLPMLLQPLPPAPFVDADAPLPWPSSCLHILYTVYIDEHTYVHESVGVLGWRQTWSSRRKKRWGKDRWLGKSTGKHVRYRSVGRFIPSPVKVLITYPAHPASPI